MKRDSLWFYAEIKDCLALKQRLNYRWTRRCHPLIMKYHKRDLFPTATGFSHTFVSIESTKRTVAFDYPSITNPDTKAGTRTMLTLPLHSQLLHAAIFHPVSYP